MASGSGDAEHRLRLDLQRCVRQLRRLWCCGGDEEVELARLTPEEPGTGDGGDEEVELARLTPEEPGTSDESGRADGNAAAAAAPGPTPLEEALAELREWYTASLQRSCADPGDPDRTYAYIYLYFKQDQLMHGDFGRNRQPVENADWRAFYTSCIYIGSSKSRGWDGRYTRALGVRTLHGKQERLCQFTRPKGNSVLVLAVGPPDGAGRRPLSGHMASNCERLLVAWRRDIGPALLQKNKPTCYGIVKHQWGEMTKKLVGEYLFKSIHRAWLNGDNRDRLYGTDTNPAYDDWAYYVSVDELDTLIVI